MLAFGAGDDGSNPSGTTVKSIIAGCADHISEFERTQKQCRKALDIQEKVPGTDHPDTALSYINIGSLYCNMGEFEKALEYYSKAYNVVRKALGEKHNYTVSVKAAIDAIKEKQRNS